VWDYGGQRIFSKLHHLFLTAYGVYCVLFNLKWLAAAPGSEEHRKCLEYLRFWLNSIAVHTATSSAGGKSISFAPIFLLGTHKDHVPAVARHEAISKVLNEAFGGMLVWPAVQKYSRGRVSSGRGKLCFYPINNRLGQGDPAVRHAMEDMHKEVMQESYVRNKVPFPWLKLLDKLRALDRSWIRLAEVQRMARRLGFPTGVETLEREVGLLLAFFNQVSCFRNLTQDVGTVDI
jgi:hypothetical protein